MKNTLVFCFLVLVFSTLIAAQPKAVNIQISKFDLISNKAFSFIRMNGYLGGKIDLCINQRIKRQDVDELIEPFRHRNETRLWQTEFLGKWILSAVAAYQYSNDPELFTIIGNAAKGLMATQTPDGYIGNYTSEAQLQQWDIWGRKYTMLGLLAYYDISKDKSALDAACKSANHLLSQVGPEAANIIKTGNFRGMASSSVLEPIVLLYNHTGDKRYLEFAKYIVKQWESADGPRLISKAIEGVAVANRFPLPISWWSWDNGQKAYEMMSCYEGLLELYRITGEPTYLKSTEMTVQNIIDSEINLAGSGTAFECFYNGSQRQTEPTYHTMETCVTVTWIKLCNNLLCLTGNPKYADQIEKTVYNALLASMKDDGSKIAKYSPLEGRRSEGGDQCGMHIHCCSANGPRAFSLIPKIAIQSSPNEIFVNLYCQSSSIVSINKKNKVKIEQKTYYPESNEIEITLLPEKPDNFSLNLRIPAWSNLTAISVNGETVADVTPGNYKKINRLWQKGDKVILKMDMNSRMIELNGYQALLRGPVLLARDSRFSDGFVDETAVIQQKNNQVEILPSIDKPEHVWMSFTAPAYLGTDLENKTKKVVQVHFCDFSSAGNTWEQDVRYRVWIPKTLNVMQTEYKAY